MNLTKADVARLGRQRLQPVKAADELLAVFVPGAIANPMNATWGHFKRRRWAATWKEHVETALLETGGRSGMRMQGRAVSFNGIPAESRKVVTFAVNVFNLLDDDNLPPSLKPCRDALVECGVISGDADRDGHRFEYAQRIDRTHRGVEIRVKLL